LQRILDNTEDSWIEVASAQGQKFLSARRQAVERIGRLPAAARESYETEYGQAAKRMLEDATARGDRGLLEEVVRRFFHTKAGYKAAYLLGSRLLDSSMPLAAAGQFDRLRNSPGAGDFEPMLSLKTACCWLRAGIPDKSVPILLKLKQETAGRGIRIGGRLVPLFDRDDEALHWLARVMGPAARPSLVRQADWPMFGGTPNRNSESSDALPLGKPVWKQSVVRDPGLGIKDRFKFIEDTLKEYEGELQDRGVLTIPAPVPVVVGNTAVYRSLGRIRAVDVRSGEPLWNFAEIDRLYRVLAADKQSARTIHRVPVNMESSEQDELRLFLNARSYRDMTYGTLCSDGQRVFALLETGFLGQDDLKVGPLPETHVLCARNDNVLAGVDLASGRLMWEIGGTRLDRSRDHAGTFFLGCGLPLGNALYCLGELDGEIALFNIDPLTGRTQWSQRLALPLGRLHNFPLRRLAGGNPSYVGGTLVCPTTGGVVIGYDAAARTLLWEYRYRINVAEGLSDPATAWGDEPLYTGADDTTRWLDSSPAIAEGSILLTPRDSNELHCLNLADGTLRWKRERGDGLFLAAVTDGAAIIVGRSGVEALRLDDGTPLWKRPVSLPGPAGRGLRAGDLYHLPLSTGELATIDLRKGRVITRSKFPAEARAGNLVAAAGTVVMQSSSALVGFRQTPESEQAIAAALARNADDPAALAARGELRLHRAQTEAGLDDLLRSVRLRSDRHSESLAVATVLESLRFDFANSREAASRIEPLLDDPTQRFEFHRLMAKGLEESGDLVAAFDHDLRLAQDAALRKMLVSVGDSLRARIPQIVAPHLADLYAKADAAKRAQLRQRLDEWVGQLASRDDLEDLRDAVASLRQLPEQNRLRSAFIAKLSAPADRAELIRQLQTLERANGEAGAAATARLARLLIDQHRGADALPLLRDLEKKYAATIALDGKTGSSLAKAWRSEPAPKTAQTRLAPWPETHLAVKRHDEDRPAHAIVPLPTERDPGSFFRNWRFESQPGTERTFTLVAFDEAGNRRWRLPMNTSNLGEDWEGEQPLKLWIQGSLIQVVMQRRLAMLDAFDGNAPPRVLWTRSLYDHNWSPAAQSRSEIGLMGLFTGDFVFYQFGAALCCADAVTGRVLWERRNLPFRYFLRGDRDYVVALNRDEPNDPYGVVMRSDTGAEVFSGAFNIPGPLLGEWSGRRVLTTNIQPPDLVMTLLDAVERKVAWTRRYPMPAWHLPIDEEAFAVLDSKFKLHIHALETGALLVEAQLDRSLNGPQVNIRRLGRRYLVLSQSVAFRVPDLLQNGRRFAPTGTMTVIDGDTGQIAWSVPMPPPQLVLDPPASAPVLVLLRRTSRLESIRSNGADSILSVLDLRNGRSIYERDETTSIERINVHLDPNGQKLIVTTDKCRLEISPTGTPLSAPPPVPSVKPEPKPAKQSPNPQKAAKQSTEPRLPAK